MRPWRLSRIVVSVALGLGGLWPGRVQALAPRVLDSRAVECAMNQRLHDFQAVLQGRRPVGHALAPLALPSPLPPRATWGEARAQAETVNGLEAGLLKRPEVFVGTLTEKLLTFALGRGVEPYDGPAVRQVVRTASAANYRFSALLEAIVHSTPFQMRASP